MCYAFQSSLSSYSDNFDTPGTAQAMEVRPWMNMPEPSPPVELVKDSGILVGKRKQLLWTRCGCGCGGAGKAKREQKRVKERGQILCTPLLLIRTAELELLRID